MASAEDVRRLALALPQVVDATRGADAVRCEVTGGKGLAWTYYRRVHPKRPRVADPAVVAIRCALERKEMLIAAGPDRFFDDDHYRGYPAVLVRLAAIGEAELAALLRAAWPLAAPKALLGRLEEE
jgi:hypothetical protein